MSQHQAFRRVAVPQQFQQQLRLVNLPAPTRGIVMDENEAFMRPGAAIIQDNWMPTMRGCKLRGGTKRHCDIHSLDDPIPSLPDVTGTRKPVISAFEYVFGTNQRMFAGQQTRLVEITSPGTPNIVKTGQTSGNYATAQMSNSSGQSVMTVVNDAGDAPLQFDGTTWTVLNASQINGPAGTPVAAGLNLTYVWKYRNRMFFIESNSMNAWYLGIDSIQGTLLQIPLSGSASFGGKLLCGFSWSTSAGDGITEKCCFLTDQGELLVFIGTNPSDPNNWRQEGRFKIAPPLGMNAHLRVGADIMIATVEGIVPVSQATTKDAAQLDLAMLTRPIKPLWREEVQAKRAWSWTMEKWDEYGGIFVTTPGDVIGQRHCLVANAATGAWCRFMGYDATCFVRLRGDLFFGTQDGLIIQAERTGFDDSVEVWHPGGIITFEGNPYVATLVGGWETLQTGGAQAVMRQARAAFTAAGGEMFVPQLDATTDYVVVLPTPPLPGPDVELLDVWDQGLWDQALWDQPGAPRAPIRNTMWVSIGKTGFTHAPICQVQVAQQAIPNVELIAIAVTFDPAGVNV